MLYPSKTDKTGAPFGGHTNIIALVIRTPAHFPARERNNKREREREKEIERESTSSLLGCYAPGGPFQIYRPQLLGISQHKESGRVKTGKVTKRGGHELACAGYHVAVPVPRPVPMVSYVVAADTVIRTEESSPVLE